MVTPMAKIDDADRETQLLVQATAAALAMAEGRPYVRLDLSGIGSGWHGGRKDAVERLVHEAMTELESVIRGDRSRPPEAGPAILARRMVEDGEVYDAHTRTYTTGPGFDAFVASLAVASEAETSAALTHAGVPAGGNYGTGS